MDKIHTHTQSSLRSKNIVFPIIGKRVFLKKPILILFVLAVFLFSFAQPVLSADFQTINLLKSDFNRLKSFSFNLPEITMPRIEMPEKLSQLPQLVENALRKMETAVSQKTETLKTAVEETVNMAVNGGVRVWRTLSLSRGEREHEMNRQGTVSDKEPIVAPPVEEETTETEELRLELAKLQLEIERLKREGIPAKQIIQQVQKITKIEPVKEIIKEVIKVDQESLTEVKGQIQALEKELAKKYSNLETRYAQLETRASQALYYPQISYMTPSLPYQNVQTGNVSLSAGNLLEFTGNSIRISGDTRVLGSLSVGAATLTIDSSGNLSTSGTINTTGTLTVKEIHTTERIIAQQSLRITPLSAAPSSPEEGEVYYDLLADKLYVWANNAWVDLTSQGTTQLAGLTSDVAIAAPSNSQLLKYNSTSSKWENWSPNYSTLAGIETLTNKTLTSPIITNIAPGADFTLTQNSVAAFTSVNAGAIVNTLYLKAGSVGIGMTGPGGKLDVLGTSSSVPQLRLTYDADTYGQFYIDATGDLAIELTDSVGDDIRIVNEDLWVCTGGSLGSPSCPAVNPAGTGNLVVAGKVYEDTTALEDKYLGKTAKAADSEKLDNLDSTAFVAAAAAGAANYPCYSHYGCNAPGNYTTCYVDPANPDNASCWTNASYSSLSKSAENVSCPSNMVKIIDTRYGAGVFCIDRWEAYNNAGTAGSARGQTPWVSINRTNAETACANATKHLCTSQEWLAACNYGSYDAETIDNDPPCVTGVAAAEGTGTNKFCRTTEGVYDMVGNVWEWTDAGTDVNNPAAAWSAGHSASGDGIGYYTDDDGYWFTTTTSRAFLRGGAWGNGALGGCFAVYLDYASSITSTSIGFRCCG